MHPVPELWWWLHPDYMAISEVVLGLLGLLAALAALIYARVIAKRQFRIMEDQGKVIDDQVILLREHKGLLGRIEQIEDEQRVVLKRQGEISERQYQIMEEQLARRAVLDIRLLFGRMYSEVTGSQDVHVVVHIGIYNSGTRSPQDGLYWKVLIPKALVQNSRLTWDEPGTDQGDAIDKFGEPCFCYENHLKEPVFPRRTTIIASLDVAMKTLDTPFMLIWSVIAEDGAFPSDDSDGEIPLTKASVQEMHFSKLSRSGIPRSSL